MDQKRDKLYPLAPLEKIIDLEERLEKKLKTVLITQLTISKN